jgi:sulfite exporter TauE/SafE
MCGPIAMILGASEFRLYYLCGRLASFTLAGGLAGYLGQVINVSLSHLGLSGFFSLSLGFLMLMSSFLLWQGFAFPISYTFARWSAPLHDKLNSWLLVKEPWPLFLFGFLTIALPCGQTLLVYSACALSGDLSTGIINGFAFGILTTPSLYIAMHARRLISKAKPWYHLVVVLSASVVGCIAILRGLAELKLIAHLSFYHLVLY